MRMQRDTRRCLLDDQRTFLVLAQLGLEGFDRVGPLQLPLLLLMPDLSIGNSIFRAGSWLE